MNRNSAKNRQRDLARVHRFYREDEAGLEGACVYCGIRANTRDHVPPVSEAAKMDLEYLKEFDPVLLPACQSCNSILGAQMLLTLLDRRDCVAEHLQRKYRRTLEWGITIANSPTKPERHTNGAKAYQLYLRWHFASTCTSQITPPDEQEPEYTRDNFTRDTLIPDLTDELMTTSWGVTGEDDNINIAMMQHFQPARGPVGWAGSVPQYIKRLEKTIGPELIPEDVFQANTMPQIRKALRLALQARLENP